MLKDIQDTQKLIKALRAFGYTPKQVSDIVNNSPRAMSGLSKGKGAIKK